MIKFFRKIRQRLLSESKFSKYLLYAIGEIILVVIGILIALQINNWNENKKLQKEEAKLLNALKKEIESNIAIIDSTIIDNDTILKISGRLIKLGLASPDFKLTAPDMIQSLGYNTNKHETSIINEILGTNSRALISNDETIVKLRTLKQAYDRADKTEFYLDEFWNSKVTNFFAKSGLGVYFVSANTNENYKPDFLLNKEFYSLLGIMNAYQLSLLYSRKDLEEELNKTLLFLNEQKNQN